MDSNRFSDNFQALKAFVSARNKEEAKIYLIQIPWLRSDEADQVLAAWIVDARTQAPGEVLKRLEERQTLLRRCRRDGVEQSFAQEAQAEETNLQAMFEVLYAEFPEMRADLKSLIAGVRSVDEMNRRLAQRPEVKNKIQAAFFAFDEEAMERFHRNSQQAEQEYEHYLQFRNIDSLNQAVELWHEVISDKKFASIPRSLRETALHNAASSHLQRHEALGRPDDLEWGLRTIHQLMEMTPVDSPDRAEVLSTYANGLKARYEQTKNLADLNQSIELNEQANQLASEATLRARILSNLAFGFLARYEHAGAPPDLERAIDAFHLALDQISDAVPDRADILANASSALRRRYELTGDFADLREAGSYGQQAVKLTPLTSPDLAKRLVLVGIAMAQQSERTGDLDNLQQSIAALEQADVLLADDAKNRAVCLMSLGFALETRYKHVGELADLEQAIQICQQAIAIASTGSTTWATAQANLGTMLWRRFARTGKIEDLDHSLTALRSAQPILLNPLERASLFNNISENRMAHYRAMDDWPSLEEAIAASREAVAITDPYAVTVQADCFNGLGNGLATKYHRTGELDDLEAAIGAYEESVKRSPQGSPEQVTHVANLGRALTDRYERFGVDSDLDRAIALLEEAVQLTSPKATARATRLNSLGSALRLRYEQTSAPDTLEQAIICDEEALRLTPDGSPDKHLYRGNLGIGLYARYRQTKALEDLNRAIAEWKQALSSPETSVSLTRSLIGKLGSGLNERYARIGKIDDLNQAIVSYEQAVNLTPQDAKQERAGHLLNLANGLHDRFQRIGTLEDLDSAVVCLQQAIELVPQDSYDYAMYMNNLGNAMRSRFEKTLSVSDLDQTIKSFEAAVKGRLRDGVERATSLTNLATALVDQYFFSEQLSDLDTAIALCREAVKITPKDDPQQEINYSVLGGALLHYYRQTKDKAKLEESLRCYQKAIDLTPLDAPNYAGYLGNLANARKYAFVETTAETITIHEIRKGYQTACEQGMNTQPGTALTHSLSWGRWEIERGAWPEAITALKDYGSKAIDKLIAEQYSRTHKEQWLRPAQELPALLAYAQAKCGEIKLAVTDIENGRARLLHEALERTTSAPDMGRLEFEQIQHSLVPNNETAAVYLLVTVVGGLALIVHYTGVTAVWLDKVTEDQVLHWLAEQKDEKTFTGYTLALEPHADWREALTAIRDVLPEIGNSLIAPITAVLKELGVAKVILIPCGQLSLLPLHAAGHLAEGQSHCFMDEFTVIYAPSARALGVCNTALSKIPAQLHTLCGVGNPLSKRAIPLEFARIEVEEIVALFPQAFALYEQQATYQALIDQLGKTTYLHLSCHGIFDAQEPLKSGVLLSDKELTVKDLIEGQQLRGTRLVVLSACQTAIADFIKLPEEAIGLPAGFIQAGAAGVIGAL